MVPLCKAILVPKTVVDDVHLFLSLLVVLSRYITNGLIWFQIKSLVEDFPVTGHVHCGWFVGLSLVCPAELGKRQFSCSGFVTEAEHDSLLGQCEVTNRLRE
jgi:hypothetical protein